MIPDFVTFDDAYLREGSRRKDADTTIPDAGKQTSEEVSEK